MTSTMKIAHKRGRARVAIAAGSIVWCVACAGVWWHMAHPAVTAQVKPAAASVQATHVMPVSISANVLFTGNVFWGRYTNDWANKSELKTAYPFSRLGEFKRDDYDAWIGGLECPTADNVHMTSAQMEAELQFNCDPAYLPEAKKWFTAFSLANNHTDNHGEQGFAETQKHLAENGIQYFGHYDPAKTADTCDVLALPARITYSDNTIKKGMLPVAACAYHGVFKIPPQESVAKISEYAGLMPVVAMPHMGAEYKPAPDQLKTDLYHHMIDAGADMVLGDHPHWVQTTEAYNGRPIIYSMGNFMFDQQGYKELTRSAAIRVNMKVDKANETLLEQWLALGEQCGSYKDTCLEQAKTKKLAKLPVTFELSVIGSNDDQKITKPATAQETSDMVTRMNWQKTTQGLRPPYSGK